MLHNKITCLPPALLTLDRLASPDASDVTPSLTLLRDDVDTLEPIELSESWLPLFSRDPSANLLPEGRRSGVLLTGVGAAGGARTGAGVGGAAEIFVILLVRAKMPCKGLQSKYLQKKKKQP